MAIQNPEYLISRQLQKLMLLVKDKKVNISKEVENPCRNNTIEFLHRLVLKSEQRFIASTSYCHYGNELLKYVLQISIDMSALRINND